MPAIDATNLRCPAPFIKVERAFGELRFGEQVVVSCDDPCFPSDCELWCKRYGHTMVSLNEQSGVYTAVIEKALKNH